MVRDRNRPGPPHPETLRAQLRGPLQPIIDAEKAKSDIADSAGVVLGDFLRHQTGASDVIVSVYLLPVVQLADRLDMLFQALV